ncbi:proline iminopeptidase-family hydrolase [Flavobacterium orientale]|uniref:Proline iminopeptidase n=1 Tax=Flavobacterium orientale TaxID=1756020 RepID=A0A917DEH9_9FLAO|nr:proline iminopeptidase-family hydrolase [Flavobacterium orientale]GGD30364.1 proline iminopeptidase [Flavobacterium orientale]
MKTKFVTLLLVITVVACNEKQANSAEENPPSSYLDYSNSDDQLTGGIKMIPITTDKGTFNVFTKRVGNNPKMRVLLLHGGPGGTHECFAAFDGYLPNEEIEYIYYDQLDSYYSDKPNDSTLWTTERFVEEVEQVRIALHLTKDNFYLLGHSWGGILAMEYALKYQQNLKGLIISNMMMSAPDYGKYANEVLGPKLDPEVLKEIKALEAKNDFSNPRYTELLMNHYYTKHILRLPLEAWPEPINRMFNHLNPNIYVYMQGHSEFGMTGDATLKNWDVTDRLKSIKTPTLVIAGTHDTMDPKHMEWVANELPNGRLLLCENGSHLAFYDDQKTYFPGLIKFVKEVNNQQFK